MSLPYNVANPSLDFPSWNPSLSNSSEPPSMTLTNGWQAVVGQNYGPIPPYQWENWMKASTGIWLQWATNSLYNFSTAGIPVWNPNQAALGGGGYGYQTGSLVQDGNGVIYTSLTGTAISPNNTVLNGISASWGSIVVPDGFQVGVTTLPKQGFVTATIMNTSTVNSTDGVLLHLTSGASSGGGTSNFDIVKVKSGNVALNNYDSMASLNINLNVSGTGIMPVMVAQNNGIINFPFYLTVGTGVNTRTPIVRVNRIIYIYGTAPPAYSPTAGAICIFVQVIGGGAGGGSTTGGTGLAAGGGGAGGYCEKFYSTPPSSSGITIGQGGTSGSAGTSTQFGSPTIMTGAGGMPGSAGALNTTVGAGGLGGVASGGDIAVNGNPGHLGVGTGSTFAISGGNGGSSIFGGAGIGGVNFTGGSASGYGSGGGGASISSTGFSSGGTGGNGVIVITEYLSM